MSRSLLQLVIRHTESLAAGPETDSDADLLLRFTRTREEAAFAELIRRHGPMVWAVCRQSLPDTADAEDAFQAVFLALVRSPGSVRDGKAIAGWLHGAAVRVVAKLKRSAVRRKRREERVASGEADRSVPEGRWNALIAAVHEEVQRLPRDMRTAFVLCELEGVRQPDAAARLGWKPGTLTSRLTRARQLLIMRLSNRGLAPTVLGTLSVAVATASAVPPPVLVESVLSLLNAGEAASPAIHLLANEVSPMVLRSKLAAAALVVACGFVTAMIPSGSASPPPPIEQDRTAAIVADVTQQTPVELQYVPHDAALFVHLDVAKLWDGKLGKSLRAADAKLFGEFVSGIQQAFGTEPGAVKSAALFVPTMKDEPALGIVLAFHKAYDSEKLKAGLADSVPKSVKTAVVSPSETVAVLLVNLDEKTYGQPLPEKSGPLTPTILEAATGKYLISVGATIANLPAGLLNQMVPEPIKPLLQAEAVSALIDLDKELTLSVRVHCADGAKAADAAKGLQTIVDQASALLEPGIAGSDKSIKAVLEAVKSGLEKAKSGVDRNTAQAVMRISSDLPFAEAIVAGTQKVRSAAARSVSSNNLKQIGIALHNYHSTHGSFPPAAVCDKNGKPLLSWRVLILPYIEQEALYREFKLDEPWDSEHNKKLIPTLVRVYSNPLSTTAKGTETHYRVFVGKGAAFDYLKGSKLPDIGDGSSNTFLVVTAKEPVIWTKPDELEFDPDKDMTKLLGFFDDVCVVGFADGSVRALNKSITKKVVHGAITINGGEVSDEK